MRGARVKVIKRNAKETDIDHTKKKRNPKSKKKRKWGAKKKEKRSGGEREGKSRCAKSILVDSSKLEDRYQRIYIYIYI